MTKIFTVAEANALLPRIRLIMEGLQSIRQEAMALRPEEWQVLEKSAGIGGSRKAGELLEMFKQFEKWLTELLGYVCEL
jgi:hypothetical protein